MKISITDKFLWDVYNFLDSTKSILDSGFKYPTMANCLPGVKNPVYKKYQKERGKRNFSKLIYYLKSHGYIKISNLEAGKAVILTKGGIDKALKTSFKLDKIKRKDDKWVMLIFDVPEKQRKSRALLRSILYNLGYKIFQKSVWISPYDVSSKTEKLLQLHNLENYAKIFLIEEI